MNSTEKILALLGSLIILLISKKSEVNFKACMDNTPYAKNLTVTVSPQPIIVKEGAVINVHYFANLLKPIEQGTKIKLTLEVYEFYLWIKIPCLSVSLKRK